MTTTIQIPLAFTTADCLQRSLYRFADRCDWNVKSNESDWEIELNSKGPLEDLEAEFKRTLIDYSLREKIRAETEQVRTLLFAHAFSNVSKGDAC